VTVGGAQFDTITAGTGNQFIDGSAGNQLITAGTAGQDTIWNGTGGTVVGGSNQALIGFGSGAQFFADKGTAGANDTITTFSQAAGQRILLQNSADTVANVLATQITVSGNTTITFADGSRLTLAGIAHLDSTFFG
jgi:hypothetical protein